jgi:5-methylcytosine-specific restriction endonuclease McrA
MATAQSDKVPAWTHARYFQFIRSALRQAWSKYPAKFEVLKTQRRRVEGQRHKFEYECAACKEWFQQKDVQVDHKEPAGSLTEYHHLPRFVENLFCAVSDLQILCKPCHLIKSKEERKLTKENKNVED